MKSTFKTVGTVMIIMVISKLMALISNQVYITYFGITSEIDIYAYATQLPNIIFNSLGTALATIVIPIFAGHIGANKKKEAFSFANNVISLSIILTIAISLLGILVAPFLVHFTKFVGPEYEFAVIALRIMFPVMVFYALNYILQGVLQSLGKFNMPALVSVPSSLIIILYVFLLGNRYGVRGLLIATFIGLSFQVIILIPPILRTEYRYKISLDYKNEDIIKALRLIPPILLGTSAYQVNLLFNVNIATKFEGAAAIITFVQNLILYAVLAFIYSITAVIFPRLTTFAAVNDMKGFKEYLAKVLKVIIYSLVPIATLFILLRFEILDFIYGWGKVTEDNIKVASIIMAFYAIGVTGIGIKEVVDRAFYALKDTFKPAINGVVMMVINIGTSLSLIYVIGVYGIPIAYSISSILGAVNLVILLRRKIGKLNEGKMLNTFLKISMSNILMIIAVIITINILGTLNIDNVLVIKIIRLGFPALVGLLIYYISTYLLGIKESRELLEKVKTKLKN